MIILKQINEIANLWNKTKNPKYKDLWYKVVKEFADGRTSSLHYVDNSNSGRDIRSGTTGIFKTDDFDGVSRIWGRASRSGNYVRRRREPAHHERRFW